MEKDLKWIKKHYGEEMAHLCRSLFPKVLENEWVLPKSLYDHFPNKRTLGSDIVNQNRVREFQDYISSFINVETKNRYIDSNLTAKELLDKAGYILYPECKSEKDIQFFRKYYKKGELLCTFWTDRLKDARVWFAVKKDVDMIKREDFKEPKRQDEYGTSVISIQFSKYNFLSIKNRYNHTVNNPDNTFNSDLDNIIPGLADAFERDYGVRDAVQNRALFELIGYVLADGKYYKYNHEINGIYYCDDNVIIQNYRVKKLPQHKMLVDYFVFDFKNNTVQLIDNRIKDSFVNCLDKIKKITHENGIIDIERENGTHVKIGINQNREIVSLQDCNLKKCKNDFLFYNKAIEKVDLPKLKNCGNSFLLNNLKLIHYLYLILKHVDHILCILTPI